MRNAIAVAMTMRFADTNLLPTDGRSVLARAFLNLRMERRINFRKGGAVVLLLLDSLKNKDYEI
jgi:hypothetical protein